MLVLAYLFINVGGGVGLHVFGICVRWFAATYCRSPVGVWMDLVGKLFLFSIQEPVTLANMQARHITNSTGRDWGCPEYPFWGFKALVKITCEFEALGGGCMTFVSKNRTVVT